MAEDEAFVLLVTGVGVVGVIGVAVLVVADCCCSLFFMLRNKAW